MFKSIGVDLAYRIQKKTESSAQVRSKRTIEKDTVKAAFPFNLA